MENVTKDKDISGNYQIDNKRVFIDDENKAIVIKDVETKAKPMEEYQLHIHFAIKRYLLRITYQKHSNTDFLWKN